MGFSTKFQPVDFLFDDIPNFDIRAFITNNFRIPDFMKQFQMARQSYSFMMSYPDYLARLVEKCGTDEAKLLNCLNIDYKVLLMLNMIHK